MITLTMNRDEMFAHVAKDNRLCKKKIKKIHSDWDKYASKHCRTLVCRKTYEYLCEETNQKYFLLFAREPSYSATFCTKIAVVETYNRTYYVICTKEKELPYIMLLSSHCINRFYERMNLERGEIKEDLLSYILACKMAANIYDNGDRLVFASSNGLELCVKDEDKKTITYRTYVTKDMLKQSQSEACHKIEKELEAYANVMKRCRNSTEWRLAGLFFTNYKSKEKEEAEAIYKEYFETDGNEI